MYLQMYSLGGPADGQTSKSTENSSLSEVWFDTGRHGGRRKSPPMAYVVVFAVNVRSRLGCERRRDA